MSFTFRDLFSEDDTEASAEQRRGLPQEGDSSLRGSSVMNNKENGDVQLFLVSELLPFIPPAISAQSGIPMEKEVAVPLPVNGSRDVELSTLYQVCPELFATEITPLNDSVVTLPAKLGGGGVTAENFSPFAAPAARSKPDKPRESVSRVGEDRPNNVSESSQEENPFWSAPASSKTVARSSHVSPPKQVVTGAQGFGNGFQAPHPAENAESLAGASVFAAPVNKLKDDDSSPNNPEESVGESAAEIKEGSSYGFGSGNPNPFESTEGFATLFSRKAEEDAEIPFPAPTETEEEPRDSESESPEPTNDREFSVPKDDPLTFENGFSAAISEPRDETPQEIAVAEEDETEFAKSETQETDPEGTLEEEPAGDPISADFAPIPSESPQGDDSSDDREMTEFAPVSIVSSPEECNQAAQPSSQVSEHEDETLRDLEFKAIFSTSEPFTLAKVARSVVGLPGIYGCALATPSKIVQASKGDQGRLGEEAREMVDSIRNLARLSGLPEAKSFTLNTDRGTVSLFLEGDCCVTVHQEGDNFGPGMREKLILIARSIHKLEE